MNNLMFLWVQYGKKIIGLLSLIFPFSFSFSYYFWIVNADETLEEISQIENYYSQLPLVGTIFDNPNSDLIFQKMDDLIDHLWTWRVYSFTLSPSHWSAKQVADWEFDYFYRTFFEKILEKNLKVVFRTMHEMNGGRYPWAWNPEEFKSAWIRIWNLSREVWLTRQNILFDFSVNHWDMPTKWTPSQNAVLFQCDQWQHPWWKNCPVFEDFYPWDEYVDIVGVSFYNRWKANSNRLWLTPSEILLDKRWKILERLRKFGKTIFIDEVWTSSIWYSWTYSKTKTKNVFDQWNLEKKEQRLSQLFSFIRENNDMFWVLYFNIDYTRWYTENSFGEADWSIFDNHNARYYDGFTTLFEWGENNLSRLYALFWWSSWMKKVEINGQVVEIESEYQDALLQIDKLLNAKYPNYKDKKAFLQKVMDIPFNDIVVTKCLTILSEIYA